MGSWEQTEHDAELASEQAYVDWAYQCVDRMIDRLTEMAEWLPGADTKANGRYQKQTRQRIDDLRAVDGQLVVGRLDLNTSETFYVGRCHVDGEDFHDTAVVDWRTPMGGKMYEHQPDDVDRRRSLEVRAKRVEAFSDEVFVKGFCAPEPIIKAVPPPGYVMPEIAMPTKPAANADALPAARARKPRREKKSQPAQAERAEKLATTAPEVDDVLRDVRARDLLLAELGRERTGRLADVVATIQAEQNDLIRADADGVLIVQGGPGTGKTIVGLHRAAYLLYSRRASSLGHNTVLVVGPNERFVTYISAVLPSLGEGDAVQASLPTLAGMGLPRADQRALRVRAVDSPDVAKVKGDLRMAAVIEGALWSRVTPVELVVGVGRRRATLSSASVSAAVKRLRKSRSYLEVRRELSRWARQSLLRELNANATRFDGVAADELESAAAEQIDDRWVPSVMPEVSARSLVADLLSNEAMLASASKGILSQAERNLVLRKPVRTAVPWTADDLPLVAEAARLVDGAPTVYGHVVVDEAQDLSPMQWRMVQHRMTGGSATILGDLAQATAPSAASSWSDVADLLKTDAAVAELTLGYRVPSEVTEVAERLLPSIDPSLRMPTSLRATGRAPEFIVVDEEDIRQTVLRTVRPLTGARALIVPESSRDSFEQLVRSHPDITVLTATESKGLEFDEVVLVEPGVIAAEQSGLRGLFVALTRSTHGLTVIRSASLPDELASLPEDDRRRPLPPPPPPDAPQGPEPQPTDRHRPEIVQHPGGHAVVKRLRKAVVRSEPGPTGSSVGALRGEFDFAEERQGWLRVRLPDGGAGWVHVRDLREIRRRSSI